MEQNETNYKTNFINNNLLCIRYKIQRNYKKVWMLLI